MHSFTLLYLPEYLNITTTVHTYDGMEINAHFQYQVGTMHQSIACSLAASAARICSMGRSRASKGFGSNSTQYNAAPHNILFTICDSYYTSKRLVSIVFWSAPDVSSSREKKIRSLKLRPSNLFLTSETRLEAQRTASSEFEHLTVSKRFLSPICLRDCSLSLCCSRCSPSLLYSQQQAATIHSSIVSQPDVVSLTMIIGSNKWKQHS